MSDEEDTGRSTRSSRAKKGAASLKTLQMLKQARTGEKKRTQQFETRDESIYDEITEEEYNKRVKDTRFKDAFVVDEDGNAAPDYEETVVWDEKDNAYSDDDPDMEEGPNNKKKAKTDKSAKKGAFNTQVKKKNAAPVAPINQRITSMFAKATKNNESSTNANISNGTTNNNDGGGDDLMADFLNKIEGEGNESNLRKRKREPKAAPLKGDTSASLDVLMGDQKESSAITSTNNTTSTTNQDDDDDDLLSPSKPSTTQSNLIKFKTLGTPTKPTNATTTTTDNAEPIVVESQSGGWRMNTGAMTSVVKASNNNIPIDPNQLLMYWIDASDIRGQPNRRVEKAGTVYVFGKVYSEESKTHVSCCVEVSNLDRVIYVAPKKAMPAKKDDSPAEKQRIASYAQDMAAIAKEFIDLAKANHGIKGIKTKWVVKTYAMDNSDVPRMEPMFYLEVRYPAREEQIAKDLSGETFSAVFGTAAPPLELFLLQKNLMGPCWLTFKNFKLEKDGGPTWCKIFARVDSIEDVAKLDQPRDAPPMKVLSLALKTILSTQTEIVIITGICHSQVSVETQSEFGGNAIEHFSAVRKPEGATYWASMEQLAKKSNKTIQIYNTERELLGYLLDQIRILDPDVIVGHNFFGYGLDVLLHRMDALKVRDWSIIGRLKRAHMPKLQSGVGGTGESTWEEKAVTSGRLICDTYVSAKEFLREVNYKLATLAKTQLGVNNKIDIDQDEIPKWIKNPTSLLSLVTVNEDDAALAMRLMFKLMVLPLTHQLTRVSGNVWSRSLRGGRAERIEFLLIHNLWDNNLILPDKNWNTKSLDANDEQKKSKKATYQGGLVLEPKRGYYDKYVLLLDFASLYPSIIQEFNVCFTTIDISRRNEKGDFLEADPPEKGKSEGILPRVIRSLVEQRRAVKAQLKSEKDATRRQQLEIRQQALKLTANSMYGCLGFEYSRFFAKPLAELITRKGRETLMKTQTLIRNTLNLEVIYGDTDSVMVATGLDDLNQAKEIGGRIKKEVNKAGSKLEIEQAGIFKTLLLDKKKRYAAIAVTEKGELVREVKGLDLVRRDWCQLSKDMQSTILDQLLSGKGKDELADFIHNYLRTKAEELTRGTIEISKFIITKALSKPPEQYPDKKSQPHVKVALMLRQQGKPVPVGEHIGYIICEGTSESFSDRAYPAEMVGKAENNLKVDTKWYLTQQIHPPLSRLLEHVSVTSSAQLAECLGLDPSKYGQAATHHSRFDPSLPAFSQMNATEKYKDCEKFSVKCPNCTKDRIIGEQQVTCTGCNQFFLQSFPFSDSNMDQDVRCPFCSKQFKFKVNNHCLTDKCGAVFQPKWIKNQLDLFVRKHIREFYEDWKTCDECHTKTRQFYYKEGQLACVTAKCKGEVRLQYTARDLFVQLEYVASIFSWKAIKSHIEKLQLQSNDYATVHLQQIFNLSLGTKKDDSLVIDMTN